MSRPMVMGSAAKLRSCPSTTMRIMNSVCDPSLWSYTNHHINVRRAARVPVQILANSGDQSGLPSFARWRLASATPGNAPRPLSSITRRYRSNHVRAAPRLF